MFLHVDIALLSTVIIISRQLALNYFSVALSLLRLWYAKYRRYL